MEKIQVKTYSTQIFFLCALWLRVVHLASPRAAVTVCFASGSLSAFVTSLNSTLRGRVFEPWSQPGTGRLIQLDQRHAPSSSADAQLAGYASPQFDSKERVKSRLSAEGYGGMICLAALLKSFSTIFPRLWRYVTILGCRLRVSVRPRRFEFTGSSCDFPAAVDRLPATTAFYLLFFRYYEEKSTGRHTSFK